MKKLIPAIVILIILVLSGCGRTAEGYTPVDDCSPELADKFVAGKQILADDFGEVVEFLKKNSDGPERLLDKEERSWIVVRFLTDDEYKLVVGPQRELRLLQSADAVNGFVPADAPLLLSNVDNVNVDAAVAKGHPATVLHFGEGNDAATLYGGCLWFFGTSGNPVGEHVAELSHGVHLFLSEDGTCSVATGHNAVAAAWEGTVVVEDNISYNSATGHLTFKGQAPDPAIHNALHCDGTCLKPATIAMKWTGNGFQTASTVFEIASSDATDTNVSTTTVG